MAINLTVAELQVFEPGIDTAQAAVWITDALAWAYRAAPCLRDADQDSEEVTAAKAVIRAAILRWSDAGSGAVTQVSTLDFSQTIDNRNPRKSLFWPSEIKQLRQLCGSGGRAFMVDTSPNVRYPGFGAWDGTFSSNPAS